ncbi:hypothetical protein AB9F35_14845 [Rhizobium leguminosarum]|uniref:hypothetical protein n=1 Tax=Rhizobium leguminosarum TaxID=384 RepID=UPI003F9D1B66
MVKALPLYATHPAPPFETPHAVIKSVVAMIGRSPIGFMDSFERRSVVIGLLPFATGDKRRQSWRVWFQRPQEGS